MCVCVEWQEGELNFKNGWDDGGGRRRQRRFTHPVGDKNLRQSDNFET